MRLCRRAAAPQLRVHPRGAVTAFGLLVQAPDLAGEVRVVLATPGWALQMLVEGGIPAETPLV